MNTGVSLMCENKHKMINTAEAAILGTVVHHIGRKSESEEIKLSNQILPEDDYELEEHLLKYYVGAFKDPEFYQFTFETGEVELNPMFNLACNIFDQPESLLEESVKMARFLYEKSDHPNIKEGDLFVSYIENVLIDDELTNAIAIFKAENKDVFFKLQQENGSFKIAIQEGLSIGKVDKGCIIFDTERDNGLKMCIVDKSNQQEARFWSQHFLNVTQRNDTFHATTHYIQMTKNFVKERLPHEEQANKVDEAEIMHQSELYFKNAEQFDLGEYKEQVFKTSNLQTKFDNYTEDYKEEKNVSLDSKFEINDYAVKKKSKVFRSVIKLDKNFHVYVHGDRNKIERIEEENGQKYYKLYFDQET